MIKTCPECRSTEVEEVNVELSFAPRTAEPVYMLGKMPVCLECGFAEYRVSEEPLAQLKRAMLFQLRGSPDGDGPRI